MLYIVKKWDAGIRGTYWGGDGVGGVGCEAGGCGAWLWLGGYLQFYTLTFTYTDIYPPHYENTPIQIYRNVHLQKPKIFR